MHGSCFCLLLFFCVQMLQKTGIWATGKAPSSINLGMLHSISPSVLPQTPQDQWEALKHLVQGNAPLAYNADGEAAAIVGRLMTADVVLTTYQVFVASQPAKAVPLHA